MKLRLNGGKQTQIGMRQKFSGAEAVHEILIDIEFQVGDSFTDLMDLVMLCTGLKREGGTAQRAVSQRVVPISRQVRQHPNGYG